jgi:hypothetical protein
MKLVDEKRALSEISQLRKSRKAVEAFGAQQDSIDADKARIDELKASLDDPASKAQSKRYDEVREALDALQKEADKAYGSRSKLLDQRTALSKKLDELYAARKERQAAFRTANDVYYAKVTKDREARHAAAKEEQRKYEEGKRKEHEAQMREDAALPAFAKEIEDCEVLINVSARVRGRRCCADAPLAHSTSAATRPSLRRAPQRQRRPCRAPRRSRCARSRQTRRWAAW